MSCYALGDIEWVWDGGKLHLGGTGEAHPNLTETHFLQSGFVLVSPSSFAIFQAENGGSAGEGAGIWVPDSHRLSDPNPALEGLSVQLALPLFLASKQRGSNWGSSEQSQGLLLGWLWAAVGCFLWPLQFRALTLSRASVGLLFFPYRHKMKSRVALQCLCITLVKFVFPETQLT